MTGKEIRSNQKTDSPPKDRHLEKPPAPAPEPSGRDEASNGKKEKKNGGYKYA